MLLQTSTATQMAINTLLAGDDVGPKDEWNPLIPSGTWSTRPYSCLPGGFSVMDLFIATSVG
ncbi:hypothetical protein PCASD_26788 [Puccinia coronata f. sp. avenae]|uniref:Uncharacterized protein n=1 Tax=Puccinia coronata f. sp. avenae TaxID=200324 RepID=A0A2N5S0I8_9BASI|nr:hypothetical protein PCASD_26788 [Puccinia coronata f. sp. avenae]